MKIYHDKVHHVHIDLEAITALSEPIVFSQTSNWEVGYPYYIHLKLHDKPLRLEYQLDKMHRRSSEEEQRLEAEHLAEFERLLDAWKELQK